MSESDGQDNRNLGAGGIAAKAGEGARMPTYAPLFKLQHYIYSIGNFRLWRELTVIQFFVGILAGIVVFVPLNFLLDGMYAFFLGVFAAVGMIRLVALSDDLGRNPILELRAFIVFTFFRPKHYVGARPLGWRYGTQQEEKRLQAMIARERTLAGPRERTAWQILRGNLAETYRSIRRGGV